MPPAEYVLIGISLIVLFAYYVKLFLEVRNAPLKTSQGFNNQARKIWVKRVQENKLDILAVQTMRNWTMAATFLGSTAIVLGLGIMSFALTTDGINELVHDFNIFGSHDHKLLIIKCMIITVIFMTSFLCFILAVRYYNHCSFLINIPPNYHLSINKESVETALSKGSLYYNLGMRGYYTALPFTLWLLGPLWLLIGTILMTAWTYKLDHGV